MNQTRWARRLLPAGGDFKVVEILFEVPGRLDRPWAGKSHLHYLRHWTQSLRHRSIIRITRHILGRTFALVPLHRGTDSASRRVSMALTGNNGASHGVTMLHEKPFGAQDNHGLDNWLLPVQLRRCSIFGPTWSGMNLRFAEDCPV